MTTQEPRIRALLSLIGVLSLGALACAKNPDAAVTERWTAHVRELSSDAMRGRQTGSPEHAKAAEYIVAQFQALGLEPGAGDGYLQPVPFVARRVRESECSLELVFPDRIERLSLGEDATFQMSVNADSLLEAPAVFVGYGLSVADAGYDDLAGAPLAGKIAVILQGGPESIPEPLRSYAQSTGARWSGLKKAGAIGLISIPNPHHSDAPWLRSAARRFGPSMSLADSAFDERGGQRLGVSVNPDRAERWFAGSHHRFSDLLALGDSGLALPVFPLVPRVRARVHFDREAVESQNVVAVLPGKSPTLKDEIVVLSAHLDHLGVGVPVDGDSIYNGAMDNANGVAVLLEVARALTRAPGPPARTVVFVCVTGEEKGLLGSRYFALRPTVPGERMIANVNVDMVLPIVPLKHIVIHGVGESDLGDEARNIATGLGITVEPDRQPERTLFIRSDQFNFIRSGVPAVAFSTSAVKDSPEDSLLHRWIRERYHAPSDDAEQPFAQDAPADLIRYVTQLTRAVADRAARPSWKESSFFRRFSAPSAQ